MKNKGTKGGEGRTGEGGVGSSDVSSRTSVPSPLERAVTAVASFRTIVFSCSHPSCQTTGTSQGRWARGDQPRQERGLVDVAHDDEHVGVRLDASEEQRKLGLPIPPLGVRDLLVCRAVEELGQRCARPQKRRDDGVEKDLRYSLLGPKPAVRVHAEEGSGLVLIVVEVRHPADHPHRLQRLNRGERSRHVRAHSSVAIHTWQAPRR